MKVLIIDAQGGGLGKMLVQAVRAAFPDIYIMAVGTNTAATTSMMKAGSNGAATGENAAIVGARTADVIMGPVGMVIADALWGEVTPKMAAALGQSQAKKILIPFNQCDILVAGVPDLSAGALIKNAVELLRGLCEA